MKIAEIEGRGSKLFVALNNEEAEFLKKMNEDQQVYKSDLTEREQLIANQLVNKDLLLRINEKSRILYKRPPGSANS